MPTNPTAVDFATLASDPAYMATAQDGSGTRTIPPISYGGKLYLCLAPNDGILTVGFWEVFQSSDAGLTWVKLDAGNGPAFPAGKQCYDGSGLFWVVYFEPPAMPSQMRVRSFDLSTGLWSAEVATGPATMGVSIVAARAGGSLIVVYQNDGTVPGGSVYLTATYLSGAWSAPVALDQNFPQCGTYEAPNGVLDSVDTLHVFWSGLAGGIWNVHYQAIDSSDTYGAFTLFSNADTLNSNSGGIPVIVGANIFLPLILTTDPNDYLQSYVGGYIGTPLAAPIWTQVVNLGAPAEVPASLPVASYDGLSTHVVYTIEVGLFASGVIRHATSSNLLSWTVTTEYDIINDPGFQRGGAQGLFDPLYVPNVGVLVTALDPTLTALQRFILLGVSPAATSTPNRLLDAARLSPIQLPGITFLDSTGANRSCFPIKSKECK